MAEVLTDTKIAALIAEAKPLPEDYVALHVNLDKTPEPRRETFTA